MNQPLQSPSLNASAWMEPALAAVARASIAVFGDVCLDAYWDLRSDLVERSIETGLPVQRVQSQRYSLGGAANVAANAKDLGAASVHVIGVVGDDGFGLHLRRQLDAGGIDSTALINGGSTFQTLVYAKPHRGDHEQSRLDFGSRVDAALMHVLLARLDVVAAACGAVVINQQIASGLEDESITAALAAIIARHPRTLFVVDARDVVLSAPGIILKLNVREAARRVDGVDPGDQPPPLAHTWRHAQTLAKQTGAPVFITRGERGLIVADATGIHEIPGIQANGAVDPVGAGDTVAAALATALAGGCTPVVAARLANTAAAITVGKLRTTGTATPAEIRALGEHPDHVWSPELADDAGAATHAPGTHIEITSRWSQPRRRLRHAIFDHDGTLSTLRQGWEQVMESMMLGAILGDRVADADGHLLARATREVRAFIDRTTGIQTLVQMQGLVELVQRFGCVAPGAVRDRAGYKAVFNEALMALVRTRTARLIAGELAAEDFQILNARVLLERLRAAGFTLHLASGTDQDDLVSEAKAMGYDQLFDGGIHGAVGDVRIEAKRVVMDRILRETGNADFVVFGDGPVEIREGHRRAGVCVGVASDEVRRIGIDPAKRRRLIRAGAGIIVGDYGQLDRLLVLLGVS